METIQEDTQKLRSKENCEKQLAMELAVGAIDSIDSLIDQGHEIACEYACQLLFDNLRKKVAIRKDLPKKIVNFLLTDRCADVRLTAVEKNWERLTDDQQEKIIDEISNYLNSLPDEKRREIFNGWYSNNTLKGHYKNIIHVALKIALTKNDEITALKLMPLLGTIQSMPINRKVSITIFKAMPKVFQLYWDKCPKHHRNTETILAHPDESIRMDEVKKILDKKTRVCDLWDWQSFVGRSSRGESLKCKILQYWATDSSEKIRKLIAKTTTNVGVLEILITDESKEIVQIASPRYKKFQKRAEYSKAYQLRKKEKAQHMYE